MHKLQVSDVKILIPKLIWDGGNCFTEQIPKKPLHKF